MIRADVFIFENGFAKSRESAKKLIEAGSVRIDGQVVGKPSEDIDTAHEHKVDVEKEKYVSRGALKLEGAFREFGLNVMGKTCIDVGASTGGFTDFLLQNGAEKVYAVDSGHGQLSESLRTDERVINIEGYNARNMSAADFPCRFSMAVMDVSFISQTYIHKGIAEVLTENGVLVSLIKPQFEAGRGAVGKGGIVKDISDRINAVLRVVESGAENGLYCKELIVSPIKGGDGNVEYLAYFTREMSDLKIDRTAVKNILSGRRK